MCGLAGVASTERRKDDLTRKSAFRQLLEVASWRGKDATGVAIVKLNEQDRPATVFKKAVKASDFIELESYRKLERNFDEYGFVIGHARSSTSDGWNMADANAHPFQYGPVTLVHNGTIRNYRILDSGMDHPVDSAHVAAALENVDDPKEVLEKLVGPFALAWHDARDSSLNFAKNHEKPLYWCHIQEQNTMFWGSELEAMYAVLNRHGFQIDGKFRLCTSYNHFKFKLGDLRKIERFPFGNRHPRPGAAGQSSLPVGRWPEETMRLRRAAGTGDTALTPIPAPSNSSSPLPPPTTSDTSSGSKIDTDSDPTETGSDVEALEFRRDSLRPRSRRKIRAVKERLFSMGRKLDAPIAFIPEYFLPYKNQRKSQRGAIRGHDKVRAQMFEMGNVTRALWGKALACGKIYGHIVNVKRDTTAKGQYVIVCDFAKELTDKFVFKPLGGAANVKPFPDRLESLGETVANILEEDRRNEPTVVGPNDRKITEKEFNELVKHGCGFCAKDLSVLDADEILWVGPHVNTPICPDCGGNADVATQLGVKQLNTVS